MAQTVVVKFALNGPLHPARLWHREYRDVQDATVHAAAEHDPAVSSHSAFRSRHA
jgi:hypothetical protein